jgi:hypothetical protein
MSRNNGDPARYNAIRKRRALRRTQMRVLRAEMMAKAAAVATADKPKE